MLDVRHVAQKQCLQLKRGLSVLYQWQNLYKLHSLIKINIFIPLTKLSVSSPLFCPYTSEKRRTSKNAAGHSVGCFLSIFLLIQLFSRPCSCWFGSPCIHIPEMHFIDTDRGMVVSGPVLTKHAGTQTPIQMFQIVEALCSARKVEILQKALLGQRTTVKSIKDERGDFENGAVNSVSL